MRIEQIDIDASPRSADDHLEQASPAEILARAVELAPRIALATGFGAEGCLLIDVIARAGLPIEVFTLDTGLLFPQTRELWRRLEVRYGMRIRAVRPEVSVEVQARLHGDRLWERDPDRCCELRKLLPLRGVLSGLDAWVSSLRREQTLQRGRARVFERDARFGLVKVNPLVAWSSERVWSYLAEHEVPVSPLHAEGYPSIGCLPCTSRVAPGEDPRAGRWRGRAKTECGLHLPTPVAAEPEEGAA